jgi:hypothetical protein
MGIHRDVYRLRRIHRYRARWFYVSFYFLNTENRLTSGIIVSEEWILEDWLKQSRVINQTHGWVLHDRAEDQKIAFEKARTNSSLP